MFTLLENCELILEIFWGFLAEIRHLIRFPSIVNFFASVLFFVIFISAAEWTRNYKSATVKL